MCSLIFSLATYAELRQEILLTLDVPPDMDEGDVRDLVEIKLKRKLDELVAKVLPTSLLVESAPVTVTSATTSIALGVGGFEVTNFARAFGVRVDMNTSDTEEAGFSKYVPYEAWLALNSLDAGNLRPAGSFTIKPDDSVVLRSWPSSGSWTVTLLYFKQTAAITDGGSPELPVYHHGILASAVVLEFPHMFQGDRAALLAIQKGNYEEQLRNLLADRDIAHSSIQLRLSAKLAPRAMGVSMWPTQRVSP